MPNVSGERDLPVARPAAANAVRARSAGTWRLRLLAAVAILFGVATVFAGSRALFGDEAARAAAGNVVGFVLWFNFGAGPAYVCAGIGLWRRRRWAVLLSAVIAIATVGIAAAFAAHVAQGGAYEPRTVGALALRIGFWAFTAWWSRREMARAG